MTEAGQIAEFLAKKGATKIPVGEGRLNMSARDWAKAVRSEKRISGRPSKEEEEQQQLIDERHEVIDHAGRIRVRNGLGEWIA